jgi:hypothetical protein
MSVQDERENRLLQPIFTHSQVFESIRKIMFGRLELELDIPVLQMKIFGLMVFPN